MKVTAKTLGACLAGIIVTGVALSLAGCGGKKSAAEAPAEAAATAADPILIGLLLETYDVARWARDEQYLSEAARASGAEVVRAVANGDQDKQNQQADTFLTKGADVLVVVPKNLKTAARIVKSAHEKSVPVLAYDRLIRNCDLDMYITFDNEQVGYLQAKGVLEKVPQGNFILLGGAASDNNAALLRKGQLKAIAEHEAATGNKINVLDDPFLDNWDKEEARRKISNMLTRFKAEDKNVDAIVASNDGTAGGAIAALKAEGLDGKVAVSGQDAELGACQRVVEGTQTVTVYKPVRLLAGAAGEIAVRLAKGETPESIAEALGYALQHLNNGTKDVPSIYLEPVFVTKENMRETVVKDGWHPEEKIYANLPAQSGGAVEAGVPKVGRAGAGE
ncbi:MAG: substrate-binding domain-containing protein [Verrucomicrobia bacterium]|nr:substrate-binding domain-containing protein [Verrucomicrobiota bacterium]MDA1087759.1 substrate-binding domain-containing protein [Verrucomicrobiota bacterium]